MQVKGVISFEVRGLWLAVVNLDGASPPAGFEGPRVGEDELCRVELVRLGFERGEAEEFLSPAPGPFIRI